MSYLPCVHVTDTLATSTAATAHRGDSARDELVEAIRDACRVHGFFQITNHGVAPELLDAILEKSELLFSLPHGVKQKYSKGGLGTALPM